MSEIEAEIRRLRADGHTQESASMALGIDRSKLRRLCTAYGITWGRRPPTKTRFRGRMRTLKQIAALTRLGYHLVHNRYWRGWRGEQLALPRTKKGVPRTKVPRPEIEQQAPCRAGH